MLEKETFDEIEKVREAGCFESEELECSLYLYTVVFSSRVSEARGKALSEHISPCMNEFGLTRESCGKLLHQGPCADNGAILGL